MPPISPTRWLWTASKLGFPCQGSLHAQSFPMQNRPQCHPDNIEIKRPHSFSASLRKNPSNNREAIYEARPWSIWGGLPKHQRLVTQYVILCLGLLTIKAKATYFWKFAVKFCRELLSQNLKVFHLLYRKCGIGQVNRTLAHSTFIHNAGHIGKWLEKDLKEESVSNQRHFTLLMLTLGKPGVNT